MNDLVKRLRHAGNDSMNHDCIYTPELIEAADRIERLRAADETYVNVDELLRENKRLFAENAALKHDIERYVEINAEIATENSILRKWMTPAMLASARPELERVLGRRTP